MDKNTDAISPAPGDRFPVPAAVPSESPSLAIAPYSFTFRAAAKGRWLGLPLLTLFAKEFAYVPSVSFEETRMDGTMPDESDNSHSKTDNNNNNNNKTTNNNSSCSGCSSSEEDSQATRDVRVTLMAYVKELQCGALWLHGREAECRAAGRAYEDEIREILCDKSNPCAVPWAVLCSDLRAKPETEAKDILGQLTARLVLRQKDVILHRVLRREAMMPGGDVIHILRYDEDVPQNLPPSHSPQRRLLVCCKPHGLPVHPSGRCRKNSVTSILSDVFGGADAFRYHAVPLDEPPLPNGVRRVAIRHKTYGFELIRVWIGPGYVSDAAWRQLRELLSVSFSFSSPSRGVKPFVVHRLDAATSGVLIFGLDAHSSRVTSALLAQKTMDSAEETDSSSGAAIGCTKQYLARVCGRFDVEELSRTQHHCSRVQSRGHFWLRVDRPIGCLSHHDSLYGTPGAEDAENWMRSKKNEIEEEKEKNEKEAALPGRKRGHLAMADIEAKRERMRQKTFGQRRARDQDADGMEHGNGDPESGDTVTNDDALRQLHETLKRAVTLVRCVSYDSSNNESVLECHLLTGRTHQVRVHLASLGHPICGDVKYYSPIGKDDDKSSGIQLHAWRYTLQYSSSEQPEILVAPPPAWAEI